MKFLMFWTVVIVAMTIFHLNGLDFGSWLCGTATGVLIADWILYFENRR